MLLAAKREGQIPAIGEIKADSEVVGPTFALIQSLMYASQIATPNQFERLAKQYPNDFGHLTKNAPTVEIIVILESIEKCISEDLAYV
ncbi:hypothetical protein, partial [Roseimaritima sediminicola]|uniref:hypothetical protein n=1 Tax=Roseimaritima sediminicola TaxID=2662066 RepID=UPI001F4278ED